jgi:hypothetical protein
MGLFPVRKLKGSVPIKAAMPPQPVSTRLLQFTIRMNEATTPDSDDTSMISNWTIPVQTWRAESTAHSIALHIEAGGPTDCESVYSITLELEQARQLIRELSSAVHASDLKRLR